MNTVKTFVTRLFKDESGASMVEYGLLIALIAVLLILTIFTLTQGIQGAFNSAIEGLGGTAAVAIVQP